MNRDRLSAQEKDLYVKSYQLWQSIFSDTFKKVISPDYVLYSDEFLLQKALGVLLLKDRPIGIIFFSELDLACPIDINRSYLKHYPEDKLEELRASYRNVFVISNLAIDPRHRKTFTEIPFSACLVALGVKSFLASKAAALITFTRNDRKTHETVKMLGGVSIAQKIVYGIESDVIVITRPRAIEALDQLELNFQTILNHYWRQAQHTKKSNAHPTWEKRSFL